jgi:hypothetical protein
VSRKYLTNLVLLSSFATIGIGVIGRRYSKARLSAEGESNIYSINFKGITKEQEINWLYYINLKAFIFNS